MFAISAMFYREGKIRITNATFIIWDIFHPLVYLLVFGVGIDAALGVPPGTGGANYIAFLLGGVLSMASLGVAANTSWSFFMDRDNGIFYEMLTYPMSRAQYLGAKVLFNIFLALLAMLITVGLAAGPLGVAIQWKFFPLLLVGMVGGTAGWFYFYSIFALIIRRNDIFNTVTSIFYFVFLFASSMFYPIEPLPVAFRWVALANPITWQVDVLRYATIGLGSPGRIALEAAAFAVFTVVSFAVAVRCLERQE